MRCSLCIKIYNNKAYKKLQIILPDILKHVYNNMFIIMFYEEEQFNFVKINILN